MTKTEFAEKFSPLIKDVLKGELKDCMDEHLKTVMEPHTKRADSLESAIAKIGSTGSTQMVRMGDGPVQTKEQRIQKATRYLQAVCAAGRRGHPEDVAKAWGDESLLKYIVEGRAQAEVRAKALGTVIGQDGGYIVPPEFSADLIELLRPASVIRSLNPIIQPMTSSLRIPKLTAGVTAQYVGENTNIPALQPQLGQLVLSFKKLAALVPFSNDLVRYSNPDAGAMVRDDLVRAMAQRENQAFISDDGTAFTPRGLRWWAAPGNVAASAGTWLTAANILTDLSAMIYNLRNNNVPMTRPGWLMNPAVHQRLMITTTTTGAFVYRDELMRGTLWGYPYAVTTQVAGSAGVADSDLYLADFADVVIGESQSIMIDASTEAAYVDGSTTISSFAQDQTVLRAISEHDFAVRRDVAVSVRTGITA